MSLVPAQLVKFHQFYGKCTNNNGNGEYFVTTLCHIALDLGDFALKA